MPKIVNVYGPMASGKSTLTGILDKELNYAYIDRAYMKTKLKPAGRANAKLISKKATYLMMKELMKLEKNILVQEMSSAEIKQKLGYYFRKYDYQLKSFYVHCSLETALERDRNRSKEPKSSMVRRVHATHKRMKRLEEDYDINTEKQSIEESIRLILKQIKKKDF